MPANPATYAEVFSAGLVRIAELGQLWLDARAEGLPVVRIEQSIQDVWFGMEAAARSTDQADQQDIIAYQIETYGLLAVGLDPLLRPLLPAIPSTGAVVRRRVRAVNGHPVGANGKFIAAGARLAPVPLLL